MSEKAPDFVTFKITKEARTWSRGEQNRLLNVEGAEPTQAELFERMKAAYLQRSGAPSVIGAAETGRRPRFRHEEEHKLLAYILENGTADERHWITGNLKTFCEAIRLRGDNTTRRAGGKS